MLRFKVPGFCRAVSWLDQAMHDRGWRVPLLCAVFDWSLGLSWREARS